MSPNGFLDAISGYDSHAILGDKSKHRKALDQLINEHDCILSNMPNSSWYPSEPIELASFGVDGQGHIVTALACCFLLIDDLMGGGMDHMHFHLSDSPGRGFFDLPTDQFRLPLQEGIAVFDALQGC